MATDDPGKLYYRIGEVARLTGLRPSVLRFWETEFEMLRPVKSGAGQRLYSRHDVELITRLKLLLHTEKLTIVGARKRLTQHRDRTEALEDFPPANQLAVLLNDVRDELIQIRNKLSTPIGA
jgi:DNA-binding transcriptional MerR regulator